MPNCADTIATATIGTATSIAAKLRSSLFTGFSSPGHTAVVGFCWFASEPIDACVMHSPQQVGLYDDEAGRMIDVRSAAGKPSRIGSDSFELHRTECDRSREWPIAA
jgi:hypothetical protein